MANTTSQDFLRGDATKQARALALAGAVSIAVLAVVIVAAGIVYPRVTAPSGREIHLVVPSLGPGITSGSKVLLRGASVGEVVKVSASDADEVWIDVVLDETSADLLTDTVSVDFRPENYFGITAVNLIAGTGGSPLVDGQTLERSKAPDFTMSTMLERGSLVVDGTLTEDIISSLDEVIRYANGLAPVIESGVIVADHVARTQQRLPSELIDRVNDLLDAFPAFNTETMRSLYAITESPYNKLDDGSRGVPEELHTLTDASLSIASSDLFGKAGALLASHGEELTPLTNLLAVLTGPLPAAIGGGATVDELIAAIERVRSAFRGNEQQKTLQLRVVLDTVPGLASPIRSTGAIRKIEKEGN